MRAFVLAFALLLSAACRPHAAPALTDWLAAGYAERQFDLAAAVDFYERALDSDPGNRKIQGRLLRMRIAAGARAESLELARSLEAASAAGGAYAGRALDKAFVALRLAVDAARRGDWPATGRLLEGGAGETLPATVRLLSLAWTHEAMGDRGAAQAALAEAGKVAGAAGWTALHRALLLQSAGRREEARAAFRTLRSAGAGARGLLAEAGFLMAGGDSEGARDLLRQYRLVGGRLHMEEPAGLAPLAAGPAEGIAEVLYGMAERLHRRRLPVALLYARLAAMLSADHHAALVLAGDILAGRDRHGEALSAYLAVPEDSIWRPAAEMRRARALASDDRFDEAIAVLEAEAAARPKDPFPLGELGHLLRGQKRFDEAATAYARAIERVGAQPESRHWRLFYGRGIAFERTRRWDLAERDLLQALDFVPNHAYVLNYLGYSWIDRGEHYDRAEEMVARAVDLRPRDGYIADSLGWVYFRTGRYSEAVEELERAAALEPLDPVVNEHLGDAYWKTGRRLEARFQWRRALEFDPEPERVDGLRQRLDCGLDCG